MSSARRPSFIVTRRRGRKERDALAAGIELASVTRRFTSPTGKVFTAIRDVNFSVEPGQFCAVVGPSGCGKSTTLGRVGHLDRASPGSVRVNGKEVNGIT